MSVPAVWDQGLVMKRSRSSPIRSHQAWKGTSPLPPRADCAGDAAVRLPDSCRRTSPGPGARLEHALSQTRATPGTTGTDLQDRRPGVGTGVTSWMVTPSPPPRRQHGRVHGQSDHSTAPCNGRSEGMNVAGATRERGEYDARAAGRTRQQRQVAPPTLRGRGRSPRPEPRHWKVITREDATGRRSGQPPRVPGSRPVAITSAARPPEARNGSRPGPPRGLPRPETRTPRRIGLGEGDACQPWRALTHRADPAGTQGAPCGPVLELRVTTQVRPIPG